MIFLDALPTLPRITSDGGTSLTPTCSLKSCAPLSIPNVSLGGMAPVSDPLRVHTGSRL
jgi:hypothetical protein